MQGKNILSGAKACAKWVCQHKKRSLLILIMLAAAYEASVVICGQPDFGDVQALLTLAENKNRPIVDVYSTPDVYLYAANLHPDKIPMPNGRVFDVVKLIDGDKIIVGDKIFTGKSDLRAAVYRDPKNGDTIIVFNGIAKPPLLAESQNIPEAWQHKYTTPFEKELTFFPSANEVIIAGAGMYGPETAAAVELYKGVLKDPKTKHVQLIGYSLGSLFVNVLAIHYHAYGTTLANIGVSKNLLTPSAKEVLGKYVDNLDAPEGDPLVNFVNRFSRPWEGGEFPVHNIKMQKSPKNHFPGSYDDAVYESKQLKLRLGQLPASKLCIPEKDITKTVVPIGDLIPFENPSKKQTRKTNYLTSLNFSL